MNTAVILAARKEKNYDVPYALKEFHIGEGKKPACWNVSSRCWTSMALATY